MKWKRRLRERLHADERVYLTSWLQWLRDMAMNVLEWIYGFVLVGGGAGIYIVREMLVDEADEQLPDEEKIQRTMWWRTGLKSGEMPRAWETHQAFFPDSSLRFWYVVLWVLSLSWMFLGLQLLQTLQRWAG